MESPYAQALRDVLSAQPVRYGQQADNIVRQIALEACTQYKSLSSRNLLAGLKSAVPALSATGELRNDILRTVTRLQVACIAAEAFSWGTIETDVLKELQSRLLRRGGPLGESFAAEILGIAASGLTYRDHDKFLAIDVLLNAVEKCAPPGPLAPASREALAAARTSLIAYADQRFEYEKTVHPEITWFRAVPAAALRRLHRIEALLDGNRHEALPNVAGWEKDAKAWLASLPHREGQAWSALISHAATTNVKRVPNRGWMNAAAGHVAAVGSQPFVRQLELWLDAQDFRFVMPDSTKAVLRGLIHAAATVDSPAIAPLLGRFGERCYKKIPDFGPGSVLLGNACMTALSLMPNNRGAAELARLKQRIRYNSGKQVLGSALGELAERAGSSVAELEERHVPDFDLDAEGRRAIAVGAYEAVVSVHGGSASLAWQDRAGKTFKTPPAALRATEADALRGVKRTVKQIGDALVAHRARVEAAYLDRRQWSFGDWRRYYLDHPLMATLTRRLIWRFESGGTAEEALFAKGALRDAAGKAIRVSDESTVTLWHPIEASAAAVAAWRSAIESLDVVQPFKQAHREIYALTDAERRTATYSNRFAAHILRQHQFRHLCQQRHWMYELQGAWDSHNIPTRRLEALGLEAEFAVEAPAPDAVDPEEGLFGHGLVVSDRVALRAGDADHPLADVPPIVFSEIMRDIDLFVSVCSVGNDPNWFDGGPEGRYRDYWHDYAFGALSGLGEQRRMILEGVIPRLRIAAQCHVDKRDLIVAGTRRTYKIHLGSGNVRMAPNDAYLCIVLDRTEAAKTGTVRLPFEGDQMLALILSKAFLLADDDKIDDPTILSQIGVAPR
ncbi:MAG: DUF4132 domain-containing protein [Rhodospirillaceae bacterium]|nr:DUF4132 domain-containing protein [Rhodospirillaceae bacterium]